MRNEPKSRAGKYDHVKPLPYKRFHPEVLKVVCALLFDHSYLENLVNGSANGLGHVNDRLYRDQCLYLTAGCDVYRGVEASTQDVGLLRIGYNWRVFKRLAEYVKAGNGTVRIYQMYPLIEEDLRDLGVLGRKRQ